jgi:hypothetical protein
MNRGPISFDNMDFAIFAMLVVVFCLLSVVTNLAFYKVPDPSPLTSIIAACLVHSRFNKIIGAE